jgi:O-antigen ligase
MNFKLQRYRKNLSSNQKSSSILTSSAPSTYSTTSYAGTTFPVQQRRSLREFRKSNPDIEFSIPQTSSSAAIWGIVMIIATSIVWLSGFQIGYEAALGIQMILCLVFSVIGLFIPSLGLLAMSTLAGLDAVASQLVLTGGLLRYNSLNYWFIITILLFIPLVLRLKDINSRTIQIFLLLITLELSFSLDLNAGIQDVLNIVATFGMVVYFARAFRDKLSFYWLGVVNGVFAALGGLIFVLQIDQLPYVNPNNWTFFHLTAIFAICISYPYAQKLNKSKLILIVLALINAAWIFLSGSRGSLLITLLCIGYLFLVTRSFTWRSVMVTLAVLITLWVSSQFLEQQSYTISRIQLLFDPNQTESRRTSKRSDLLQAGIEIFKNNPLGIGTGSFREESNATSYITGNRPAHSAWIKTIAENGVPGFLLMAMFIASFAVEGFRRRHERDGTFLFGVFITILFASAFVAKEFRGKSLWFLAAAGIVLLHPESTLAYLKEKTRSAYQENRSRLREIRFGRRKYSD